MENSWAIYIVLTWITFISFMIFIMATMDTSIFDLTAEQQAVMDNPSNDAITLLGKFTLLMTVSTEFQFLAFLSTIYTIAFIIAVAILLNEFIPFT